MILLFGTQNPAKHFDRALVRGEGAAFVARAKRRADQRGEGNDEVRVGGDLLHQLFLAAIAIARFGSFVAATVAQAVLAEDEGVHDRDLVPQPEQFGRQDRSDVTGSAGDQYFHIKGANR